jgi:serine/threonine-protein kinase
VNPDRIADYELVEYLTAGGMADLYLARGPKQPAPVVLKTIQRKYVELTRVVKMFIDEGRIAKALDHPNIVRIYDVGEERGSYFIAMELIHGRDLLAIARRGIEAGRFLPLHLAAAIVAQVANGLTYAHEKRGLDGRPLQVVHCDVSPGNVVVSFGGTVKIVDFGIARAAIQLRAEDHTVAGKFNYMSPEQIRGEPLDARADLFSLGVILYELTVGRRLFRGKPADVKARILAGRVPSPREVKPDFPEELERIVLRALALDPAQRYPRARDLRADLLAFIAVDGHAAGKREIAEYMREIFVPTGGAVARAEGAFSEGAEGEGAEGEGEEEELSLEAPVPGLADIVVDPDDPEPELLTATEADTETATATETEADTATGTVTETETEADTETATAAATGMPLASTAPSASVTETETVTELATDPAGAAAAETIAPVATLELPALKMALSTAALADDGSAPTALEESREPSSEPTTEPDVANAALARGEPPSSSASRSTPESTVDLTPPHPTVPPVSASGVVEVPDAPDPAESEITALIPLPVLPADATRIEADPRRISARAEITQVTALPPDPSGGPRAGKRTKNRTQHQSRNPDPTPRSTTDPITAPVHAPSPSDRGQSGGTGTELLVAALAILVASALYFLFR